MLPPTEPAERWEFSKSLRYHAPVGRFLFGVLDEGSDFDSGVYVWRVSMPLFMPSKVVVLSYSKRIGGDSKRYYLDDLDALTAAITSGFHNLPTENEELLRIVKLAHRSENRRLLEASACSQILLGDKAGALGTIKHADLSPSEYEWVNEVIGRLVYLRTSLEEKGLDATAREVEAQAKRTATALGLVHE